LTAGAVTGAGVWADEGKRRSSQTPKAQAHARRGERGVAIINQLLEEKVGKPGQAFQGRGFMTLGQSFPLLGYRGNKALEEFHE
jgi:hypothetical protein